MAEGDGEGGGMVAVGGERGGRGSSGIGRTTQTTPTTRNTPSSTPTTTPPNNQHEQVLPEAPRELVEELSRRYVHLYERITGLDFVPPPAGEPVAARIERALAGLK